MKIYEFDALILTDNQKDWAYVEFPYDVQIEFGTKGQVKVAATFDGYEYRGSLVKMGHHCHFIGLTKQVRATIGKGAGDNVHVVIKQDREPRTVEVPADFNTLLDRNHEARRFFDKLSYSNRRQYVQWITGAKKAETRERRLHDAIAKLLAGVKQP